MVPGLREVGEEVDRDEEQQQHPDGPLLHLRDRVVQDGGQAQAARAVPAEREDAELDVREEKREGSSYS